MKNYIHSILFFGLIFSWPLSGDQNYTAKKVEVTLPQFQNSLEDFDTSGIEFIFAIPRTFNEQGDVAGEVISRESLDNSYFLFHLDHEGNLSSTPIPNRIHKIYMNDNGRIVGNIRDSNAPFILYDKTKPLVVADSCSTQYQMGILDLAPKVHGIESDEKVFISCISRNLSNWNKVKKNYKQYFTSKEKFWSLLKTLKDIGKDATFGDSYTYVASDSKYKSSNIIFSDVHGIVDNQFFLGSVVDRNEEGKDVYSIQFLDIENQAPTLYEYPSSAKILHHNQKGSVLVLPKEKESSLTVWKMRPQMDDSIQVSPVSTGEISKRDSLNAKIGPNDEVYFINKEGAHVWKDKARHVLQAEEDEMNIQVEEILDINKTGELLVRGSATSDSGNIEGYWILKPIED